MAVHDQLPMMVGDSGLEALVISRLGLTDDPGWTIEQRNLLEVSTLNTSTDLVVIRMGYHMLLWETRGTRGACILPMTPGRKCRVNESFVIQCDEVTTSLRRRGGGDCVSQTGTRRGLRVTTEQALP